MVNHNTSQTTWRAIGICCATQVHVDSYKRNKNNGMNRFLVYDGNEKNARSEFSKFTEMCPIVELYNDRLLVDRYDKVLEIAANSNADMLSKIGKLTLDIKEDIYDHRTAESD